MAEVIAEGAHDHPLPPRGRRPRYPWETWRDGQWRFAREGVDYTCTSASFRTAVYAHARIAGTAAHTYMVDDGVAFVILVHEDDPVPRYPGM